jgi:ATP-dependent RNA helicase DeaD
LEVGSVHGVQPGNIVGAIANEARLDGSQINGIDIRGDHSFVRLPEDMPPALLERLQKVRVKGQLLAISRVERRPPPNKAARRAERERKAR